MKSVATKPNKNLLFLMMFRGAETHPGPVVLGIGPILVKLYNVCMFQMYEVIKHSLHLLLRRQ